ncbi:hypothetical protein EAE99_005442 [Botrytis elliptica]|nr:hypothetical protein EAE99_005442 [Botrytis elliptica]
MQKKFSFLLTLIGDIGLACLSCGWLQESTSRYLRYFLESDAISPKRSIANYTSTISEVSSGEYGEQMWSRINKV